MDPPKLNPAELEALKVILAFNGFVVNQGSTTNTTNPATGALAAAPAAVMSANPQPAPNPAPKPTRKPAPKPATKPASKPASKPVSKPASKPSPACDDADDSDDDDDDGDDGNNFDDRGRRLKFRRPPIHVGWVKDEDRPKGSPGRKEYRLRQVLDMTKHDYGYVRDTIKILLMRTKGINMQAAPTHQQRHLIDNVVMKAAKLLPEFEKYSHVDYWPLRGFIHKRLRAGADVYNRRIREAKKAKAKKEEQERERAKAEVEAETNRKASEDMDLEERATESNPNTEAGEDIGLEEQTTTGNEPASEHAGNPDTTMAFHDDAVGNLTEGLSRMAVDPNVSTNPQDLNDEDEDKEDVGAFDIRQTVLDPPIPAAIPGSARPSSADNPAVPTPLVVSNPTQALAHGPTGDLPDHTHPTQLTRSAALASTNCSSPAPYSKPAEPERPTTTPTHPSVEPPAPTTLVDFISPDMLIQLQRMATLPADQHTRVAPGLQQLLHYMVLGQSLAASGSGLAPGVSPFVAPGTSPFVGPGASPFVTPGASPFANPPVAGVIDPSIAPIHAPIHASVPAPPPPALALASTPLLPVQSKPRPKVKAPPVLEPEPELLGYESDAPSASSSNPPLDDGAGDEAKDPAADTRSVASGGKSGKGGKQAGTGGGKQTLKKGDAKVGGTKVGSAKAGGAKADGVKTGGKGGRAKGEAGKGASKGASGAGGASGAMGKVKAKAKTTLGKETLDSAANPGISSAPARSTRSKKK